MRHKKVLLVLVLLGTFLWPILSHVGIFTAHETKGKDIPYYEAKNYFYEGQEHMPVCSKVCTDAIFDASFGSASHLDENNRPTPIDFSRQFVIAVVLPATNRQQTIHLGRLVEQEQQLTLFYKLENGPIRSTKIRPQALILVDKKYASHQVSAIQE